MLTLRHWGHPGRPTRVTVPVSFYFLDLCRFYDDDPAQIPLFEAWFTSVQLTNPHLEDWLLPWFTHAAYFPPDILPSQRDIDMKLVCLAWNGPTGSKSANGDDICSPCAQLHPPDKNGKREPCRRDICLANTCHEHHICLFCGDGSHGLYDTGANGCKERKKLLQA